VTAYKINFIAKVQVDLDDDVLEPISWYLSYLYKNGQILEGYQLVERKEGLWVLVSAPDDEALKAENNSSYANQYLRAVQEHFDVSLEPLGKIMSQDEACICKEPSWYILYTDWTRPESPVVCGDCGKAVPLYRLPYIMSSDEHGGILGWQEAYRSTDILWIYCLADRFTFRQMHNPSSRLSKDGISICTALEEKLGKPVYYYLFNWHRTNRMCPVCGRDWKIDGEKTFVDFRCEKCRLVADKTS